MRQMWSKFGRGISFFTSNPFFSGSLVMILGTNFGNFIAYLYHVVFGRMLGPEKYGELAVIISFIGFFSSFLSFMSLVIVKFVSAGSTKESEVFYGWLSRKSLYFGFVLGGLLMLATPIFSDFLHLEQSIFLFVGPSVVFTLLLLMNTSFLQGLLKFKEYVVANNVMIIGRLLLGLLFLFLGLSVSGAVLGIFLSSLFAWVLSKKFLSNLAQKSFTKEYLPGKKMFRFAIPVFVMTMAGTSLYSTDLVLVKHYFNGFDAGIYASLSTLGKVILFSVMPIGAVMFPLVSKGYSKGQETYKYLLTAMAITLGIGGSVLAIFGLFPQLTISILFGSKFLEASNYLVWFGVFAFIYTLSLLFINYYFSINKTSSGYLVLFAALVQIIGIYFYHQSLAAVILVNILTSLFLLLSLIFYGITRQSSVEPD